MRTYFAYVPDRRATQRSYRGDAWLGSEGESVDFRAFVEAVANQNGCWWLSPAGLNGGWNDEDPPEGRTC